MKEYIVTIIALALICTIVNAQNITVSHQVRVNDEVKKQQVEYAAVDSTGQNMVWDLSEEESRGRFYWSLVIILLLEEIKTEKLQIL